MDTYPPDLISPKQAAAILHCSSANVRQMIAQCKIPAWRINHRWFVSESDVRAMVKRFVPPDGSDMPESITERRNRERETDAILRYCGVRK